MLISHAGNTLSSFLFCRLFMFVRLFLYFDVSSKVCFSVMFVLFCCIVMCFSFLFCCFIVRVLACSPIRSSSLPFVSSFPFVSLVYFMSFLSRVIMVTVVTH